MPRPDRFIPGKRPDLHCGLRHEHIITVRGIMLTLKDFTLWRGILQQMEVCLLEEQLWLVVCMEF